jgi:hypothetical protein
MGVAVWELMLAFVFVAWADPQLVEQAVRRLGRQDRRPAQAGRAVAVPQPRRKSGKCNARGAACLAGFQ